ncbi:MAG TPA: phytanoyl-CoA dioxygenase family protein [Chitinophagales bacterium]|nr:phytanoyl-CoA dioxygenase family protein [Chitinophagales bacterium]
MRRVLQDDILEKQFQKDGYVQIPFITAEEVEGLKKKFFDLLPKSGGNITVDDLGGDSNAITYDFTFIDKNIEYKQAVYDVVTEYFKPHVAKWLADFRPIIANYIRKQSETGEVPLHENWAFVDERKYTSVSIWCPLVDSFEENGTLQVVPGSHKRYGEVRGPMIPWELENIKHEIIKDYLVPMNLKAGNAVVLDDSIVHYSAINKTNQLRLAIQLILVPAEVPSIHYHMNPAKSKDNVEILEVDTEFYMQFNPWKQPEGAKCVGSFKFDFKPMDIKTFDKKLREPRFDEPNGIVSKLKAIFA